MRPTAKQCLQTTTVLCGGRHRLRGFVCWKETDRNGEPGLDVHTDTHKCSLPIAHPFHRVL